MEVSERKMSEVSNINRDVTSVSDASALSMSVNCSVPAPVQDGGELMRLLRKALDTTVNKCVSRETVQRLFFKNYPELSKKHRTSLEGIHKQYVEKLDMIIRDEITVMFEEEGLAELLNELEQLAKSSEAGHIAWRPSGKPKDDIRTHLMVIKLKQQAKLEQILREEREEGERLHELLTAKRRHLLKTAVKCKHNEEQIQQATSDLSKDSLETFLAKHHLQNNNQP